MPPLVPPIFGAADNTTFKRTPTGYSPISRLRNVRVFNPKSERPQVGKRAGLRRLIEATVGAGPVQALRAVSLASRVTGYIPGEATLIDDGTSVQADDINGNAFLLDNSPGMTRVHFLDATAQGAPATNGVQVVAWHPSGDRYAVASRYNDTGTGLDESYIRCYRASDGALLWSKLLDYAAFNDTTASGTRVVSMAFSAEYLFVAARAKVIALKYDDGQSVLVGGAPDVTDCGGWSSETVAVAVYTSGATTSLYVAFMGSQQGGTVTNNSGSFAVVAGMPASHWRAGVMKFNILTIAAAVAASDSAMQQTPWGQTLSGGIGGTPDNVGDTYYETFHGYFRFSEQSRLKPLGCRPTCMSIGPGGVVYLGRTSHGFGPTIAAEHQPNGANIEDLTLMKINAGGTMVWEATTLGALPGESGIGGFQNDIPTSSSDRTAIVSIAADRAGNLFACGRINVAGNSIFKVRGTDGSILWATTTQDTGEVAESVAVDADGGVIIAGQQNDDWGTATFAHLWKLASDTAEVVWGYPNTATATGLGTDVDAYSVAVSSDGQIIYGTGKVTGSTTTGGAWTYQDGYWIQAAALRTVLIADALQRQPISIKIQGGNIAARLYADVFLSGDGRTCIRAGIKDNSDVAIDTVEFGDTITNLASAAHGLSTGQIFTLEVRVTNDTIGIYLNGSDTAVLEHALTAPQLAQFGHLRHFGFESAVASARVLSATYSALQAQTQNREEALIAVCDGNASMITDGEEGATARVLAAGAFNETGPVSLTDFEQHVYGVDGTHGVDIDPVEGTVEPWGDASGDGILPGATEDPANPGDYLPGTTRMTIVYTALSRVGLAGDPQDPQNLWECGVGTPNDWNTASVDRSGRAFGTPVDLPGRIGEPILAVIQMSKGVRLIGCANSIWRMTGDPALGIPDISPVAVGTGVSGKDAMLMLADGRAIVHTPEGVYLVGVVGDAIPLSQDILSEGLQIKREEAGDYLVQVIRDTRRHLVHFFMTTVESGSVTHFAYDERSGAFRPGLGGFFPDVFPDSVGPTASGLWQGRLVLGTRDGRLLIFDDDVASDDGEAIDATYPMNVMDDGTENHETILSQLNIVPARDSDTVTYRVYAGLTAEQVYNEDDRRLLMSGTAPASGAPIKRKVRGPALLLELSNAVVDENFRVEHVEALWTLGRLNPRRFTAPAKEYDAPSSPPQPAADDDSPDSGGGSLVTRQQESFIWVDNGYGIGVAVGARGTHQSMGFTATPGGPIRGDAGGGVIVIPK